MMMLFEEVGCNLYSSGNICRRLIEKRMGEVHIMNLDVYDDDGLDDSRIADVTAHAALTSHYTTSPRMTCGTFDLFQTSQDDPSPMPTLIFTLYHSITLLICMTKFNLTAIIMSFPDKYYSVAVS